MGGPENFRKKLMTVSPPSFIERDAIWLHKWFEKTQKLRKIFVKISQYFDQHVFQKDAFKVIRISPRLDAQVLPEL